MHAGVAVLGSDLTVRAWNPQAEDLWGLRADEVQGQHFLNLDIGLPVEKLVGEIRSVLSADGTPERVTLEALNRRGRTIEVAVTLSPLAGEKEPAGVVLLMEEVDHGDGASR
jgi:two-component system CheB/CheR fusion protein